MAYDAIIFDLDGTAMPSDRHGMPSQKMCDVVRNNRNALKLCAATGRSWPHTKPVVQALGIKDLCIISGGTQIIDPVTEMIVWQQVIPAATAQAILQVAKLYSYRFAYSKDLDISEPLDPNAADITLDVNTVYIFDAPSN